MHLHKRYSKETYDTYLDDLSPGDEVIVRQNGHEFLIMDVESVCNDTGHVFCEDGVVFDIDGKCHGPVCEIMLPTETTKKQLDGCEYRKDLIDRFDEAYDKQKIATAWEPSLVGIITHVATCNPNALYEMFLIAADTEEIVSAPLDNLKSVVSHMERE